MSLNVRPASVETCHCVCSGADPVAAAVKLTCVLKQAACDAGEVVTAGVVSTFSVAEPFAKSPAAFVAVALIDCGPEVDAWNVMLFVLPATAPAVPPGEVIVTDGGTLHV